MAFEMLPIHRLNTEVLTNNIASRKTAINAGYTPEGFKRESVYRCGDRLTSEFFGLLREEWMELERVKAMGNCCNLSYTPKDGKN
jgi:RimJ/RimL family protein N-acetyltransferase